MLDELPPVAISLRVERQGEGTKRHGRRRRLFRQLHRELKSNRPATEPWRIDRAQLRCLRSVTPGQQLVDPDDLVVGDAAEDVGEPGLRIDSVQLGALDQGVGDGRRSAAARGADELLPWNWQTSTATPSA